MPAVWTDDKGDFDLQIANQTGIVFTNLFANGDPLASQNAAVAADFNIAKRAFGTFPSGLDYRTHAVGAMIVWSNPSTIPAQGRGSWFGIRNALNGQYFWRLVNHSAYSGSNEPRVGFEYHDQNGALQSNIIYNPGFGGNPGSGPNALWFIEIQVAGSYSVQCLIRQVTASGESVIANYAPAPIIYNARGPTATEELVVSIPNGGSAGGFMGKFAIATAPFTFAERSALAASAFSV